MNSKKLTAIFYAVAITALALSICAWSKSHKELKAAEERANNAHAIRVMMESAAKTPKTSANYGLAQLCLAIGAICVNGGVK